MGNRLLEKTMSDEFRNLVQRINDVYTERNACVSLIARMALKMGLRAGMKNDPGTIAFSNVCYIDLPSGQISWHIADKDMHYFVGIPDYDDIWDGHDTPTKYERVKKPGFEPELFWPDGMKCHTDEQQCEWPHCVNAKSGPSYFDHECQRRFLIAMGMPICPKCKEPIRDEMGHSCP